jgi:hypothetical protein
MFPTIHMLRCVSKASLQAPEIAPVLVYRSSAVGFHLSDRPAVDVLTQTGGCHGFLPRFVPLRLPT